METTTALKIAVIVGSTRQARFSEKPARWIFEEAQKLTGVAADLIDLRDYPLPFFNEPQSPSYMKGPYSNEIAEKLAAKINEMDAYVIVTPEYNHGYPAVLKNALDYGRSEWHNKPVGFVGYGSVGGARSVEQLRAVAIELQMAPIKNSLHIPQFWTLTDEKGNLKTEGLQEGAKKLFDQLLWWARALKAARMPAA